MYKKFIKIVEQNLVVELEKYNFKYLKKEKYFIGVSDELIFRISFDTAGYGSRVEITMEYDYPLIRDNLIILPKYHMNFSALAENKNWIINYERKEDSQQIDIRVDKYILDMKFIFENYFYILASRIVNSFDIETFIEHEYDNLFDEYLEEVGEEDPAWTYQEEFMNSGKLQEDWTEDDGAKCEELTKAYQDKYFPYEKIKKEILVNIEKNRPIYHKKIEELFGKDAKQVQYDKDILSITLEELFSDSQITEELNNLGFVRKYDINIQGKPNYGETYYFEKNDIELLVIIKDELFLEFIVNDVKKSKRVNVYDGGYFWFGWLIGKKDNSKENIENAFDALKKAL